MKIPGCSYIAIETTSSITTDKKKKKKKTLLASIVVPWVDNYDTGMSYWYCASSSGSSISNLYPW